MVQWLGLCAFTAEGSGLIPGQGTKIPQVAQHAAHPPTPRPPKKEESAKEMPDSQGILHKRPKERVWCFGGPTSGSDAT